jgi:hypothetical protein
MKKIYALIFITALVLTTNAQVFWTENFSNGCTSDCQASGYNGTNGQWTETATGTNDGAANAWYVSCAENGEAVGSCGAGCGNNPTLHVGTASAISGDLGAAYFSGGLCGGIGLCVNTDKRIESPTIDCSAKSNITLNFRYIKNGDGTTDDATVWYYNGSAWTQLSTIAATLTGCGGQGIWAAYSFALPASANNNANVKVGFRWVNNDDGVGTDPSFAVDSITLSTPAAVSTINAPTVTDSVHCNCDAFTASFTSTGTFTAGNVYTLQLSDETGSFAVPTSIGTLPSTANSGTINATIPCNVTSGAAFAIRVVSSAPPVTGNAGSYTLSISSSIKAETLSTNTSCYDSCDGIIVIDVLGGLPPYAYQWSNGSVNDSLLNACRGIYNVTVTDINGCIKTAIDTVEQPDKVIVNIAANDTLCKGETITLSPQITGGTSPYNIHYSPAGPVISPSNNTTYIITVEDANNCLSANKFVSIVVNPQPLATLSGDTVLCAGESTDITASGGASYSWSSGVSTATATLAPAVSTTYNVTITSEENCSATGSVDISVYNCVGVEENEVAQISIYPNPVTDILTIDASLFNAPINVSVMGIDGRVLLQSTIEGKATLDMNPFSSGTYIVGLNNMGKISYFKLQKL